MSSQACAAWNITSARQSFEMSGRTDCFPASVCHSGLNPDTKWAASERSEITPSTHLGVIHSEEDIREWVQEVLTFIYCLLLWRLPMAVFLYCFRRNTFTFMSLLIVMLSVLTSSTFLFSSQTWFYIVASSLNPQPHSHHNLPKGKIQHC